MQTASIAFPFRNQTQHASMLSPIFERIYCTSNSGMDGKHTSGIEIASAQHKLCHNERCDMRFIRYYNNVCVLPEMRPSIRKTRQIQFTKQKHQFMNISIVYCNAKTDFLCIHLPIY